MDDRVTELILGRCTVRPWRAGDEPSLTRHANNRRVSLNMRDRFPYPYSHADAEEWIRTASAETPVTNFAVVVAGSAVGGIGFELGADVFRRSAEIGYWLGEAYWGRGIATEALRAMTDYAFAHLDICRIYAVVFEDNPASARVLEKAGYTCEGRLRQSIVKDGRTMDSLLYAAVRDPKS